MFFRRLCFSISAILVSTSLVAACIYTPTQCQCTKSTSPGYCMRHESGTGASALCRVDDCKKGGYKCDCSGASLCTLNPCSAWTAPALTGTEAVGDLVSCALDPSGSATERKCVHFAGAAPSASPSPGSPPSVSSTPTATPTPSSSVVVTKEVRIGPALAGAELFDLPKWADPVAISYIYNPVDPQNIVWPINTAFKKRFINIRIYDDTSSPQKFICVAYNAPGGAPDGQGVMTAKVTVTGVNGQSISTLLCDDPGECTISGGSVLLYNHFISTFNNDGFCLGDLRNGPVKLDFTELNAFDGVSFQSPAGIEHEYLFTDNPLTSGMTTTGLDGNGNSNDGSLEVNVDLVNGFAPI